LVGNSRICKLMAGSDRIELSNRRSYRPRRRTIHAKEINPAKSAGVPELCNWLGVNCRYQANPLKKPLSGLLVKNALGSGSYQVGRAIGSASWMSGNHRISNRSISLGRRTVYASWPLCTRLHTRPKLRNAVARLARLLHSSTTRRGSRIC
jgi:hypothetical protein